MKRPYEVPEWLEVYLQKRKVTVGKAASPLKVKIRERMAYRSYINSLTERSK